MIEGIVISLKILVIEMGDRGSKSNFYIKFVKEQRVDGYSVLYAVRYTLVAGKAGYWKKLSNSRLKLSQ